MSKTVVIVGALDTKGSDFAFVKERVARAGLQSIVIDVGVLGEPGFLPEISRERVCEAAGNNLDELRRESDKSKAMETMATGLSRIVRDLYEHGKIDGILGMGGSSSTFIATTAMRALPNSVPKVLVSSVISGYLAGNGQTNDICLIPSIVDVAGINRISRRVYDRAANALAGMMLFAETELIHQRPLIAASMFGNSTAAVDRARSRLVDRGYEVLVFHATGSGGATMEQLISTGEVVAVLDMTTTELADYVCGGVCSAGPDRCMAAALAGLPTVLVPGCVDMANFGSPTSVPERYRRRTLYSWNPQVTLLRTNIAENRRIGELIAHAANAATGPVAVLFPLRGVSMLDSVGGPFWDPEADAACFQAISDTVRPGIPIEALNHNINDPEFADSVAERLIDLMAQN